MIRRKLNQKVVVFHQRGWLAGASFRAGFGELVYLRELFSRFELLCGRFYLWFAC